MRAARLLRDATARLADTGVSGPARDARLLLAHALDTKPDRLLLYLSEDMPSDAADCFEAFITRRASREPLSHIIGRRAFYGRDFLVSKEALDPRPETECLIEAALKKGFGTVLDLGLGTGCILLTLLCENSASSGVGVDLSSDALQIAHKNRDRFDLGARADLRQGSWFAPVSERFDLIVSNPPYIAKHEMKALSPEVQCYEPHMALTDFADGLDAYRVICSEAGRYLSPNGRLLVEIGPTQGAAVTDLMASAGLSNVVILPDLDGRDRVVQAENLLKTC